jgi:WD40 repeat protein
VWDWESGAAPRKVEAGLRSGLQGLRFSPDGRTLYVMGDVGSARGFDVATGKPAGRLEVGSAARWVTFSPDGNTYAVGHFNTSARREASVSLREAATGKEVASLRCGTDVADHGRWSRDGNRFAAVTDHRVWVWDVKTGKPFGPDVPGHEAAITEMVFAPDGRLYTASDDHTVRAWDPATGKELLKLPMDGWVRGMAISPDGGLVAGNGLRNDFRVWDAKTGRQVFKLRGHGEMGGFRKVRFSADEQTLLSYGDDFYLRVWDTLTGKLKAEHRFLPRGRVGGADPDDDRFERDLMMFGEREADMGPDGNTLVRAVGKDVSVVAADTGKERFKFEADPQSVHKLALSPDGKRLATSGPGVVPPKLKPGEMPARPNDYQVTVWDLRDATAVAKFRVAGSDFAGLLQFTPDGRSVVTSSSEAVLRFWDAKTGAAIGTVEFPDKVARVAFDGGMKRVAVSFWDTTAVVYDLAAVLKPAKKE